MRRVWLWTCRAGCAFFMDGAVGSGGIQDAWRCAPSVAEISGFVMDGAAPTLDAIAGNIALPLEYFDLESTLLFRGGENAIVPKEEFDAFNGFIIFDELSRCGSGGVL
ncbi:hypothetical protein BG005_010030 [Podila minutissima]|nr:hypothetical protein BG005_010030 [Podila minutissima]